jgi:hypothetical protein
LNIVVSRGLGSSSHTNLLNVQANANSRIAGALNSLYPEAIRLELETIQKEEGEIATFSILVTGTEYL